jgi:hypothetical protein
MIVDGIDLETLSLEELRALRTRWYVEAQRDGTLWSIDRVIRTLGTRRPKKHGETITWQSGEIVASLDTWTGTIGVRVGERTVCSTGGAGLFVPGPWVDVIRSADLEAQTTAVLQDGQREGEERRKLLELLGGKG